MSITIKNLGEGQLAATVSDMYTVAVLKTTIVRQIVLVNTDIVARTINLYYTKSGSSDRALFELAYSVDAGKSVCLDRIVTMGAGDKLRGSASAANAVDYIISGIERS
jgi:hypothetical protein